MARTKKRTCRKHRCEDEPYLGGLCRKHHDEQAELRRRDDDGRTLLDRYTVDGSVVGTQTLEEELDRIRQYWSDSCRAVQQQRDIGVIPLEEAEYAITWCIRIASGIVDDERAARKDPSTKGTIEMRRHFWERFDFLEQGLHSNGTTRA